MKLEGKGGVLQGGGEDEATLKTLDGDVKEMTGQRDPNAEISGGGGVGVGGGKLMEHVSLHMC